MTKIQAFNAYTHNSNSPSHATNSHRTHFIPNHHESTNKVRNHFRLPALVNKKDAPTYTHKFGQTIILSKLKTSKSQGKVCSFFIFGHAKWSAKQFWEMGCGYLFGSKT